METVVEGITFREHGTFREHLSGTFRAVGRREQHGTLAVATEAEATDEGEVVEMEVEGQVASTPSTLTPTLIANPDRQP